MPIAAQSVAASQLQSAALKIPARPRLDSVDLLRGLIMVLMALDHTRDFFTNARFDPLDLSQTTPAYFITRWITHFCAPVFIFLAGVGASLSRIRGKPTKDLSWFLFSRGLWLAFLEVTWVYSLGWAFNFDLRNVGVGVLWAIGWSMVILSALVWLPAWAVGIFGVAVIALHNLFDAVRPEQFANFGWLITILHSPGSLYKAPNWNLGVGYVVVPWVGVIAAGYAFGQLFSWKPEPRRKFTFTLGLLLTASFIVIRGLNGYGDPRPRVIHDPLLHSIFSFVDCTKYPPSLDYLLMTLGPALILLPLLEKTPTSLKPFLVFGRVPLFYYLIHLPLIHALAVLVAWIRHGRADWLFHSPFSNTQPSPPNAGFGLLGVYLFWALVILILYPVCRWFANVKMRRRDAWLSYL